MKNRRWPWIAGFALVIVAALWLRGEAGAVSSTLSRDASGWLAARRLLEATGSRVVLHDGPLTTLAEPGILVLAFPWQHPVSSEDREALGGFLGRTGTVIVAYSGERDDRRETQVLENLQLEQIPLRPPPPLTPHRWWTYRTATWELTPTTEWQGLPSLAVRALGFAPEAPTDARVFYRLPDGSPLIFDYPLHRGRVVVLPAELFANAWIAESGNADFLESLRGWLGDPWIFDEYHHGLVGIASVPENASRFAWDLFVAHLVLIYLLGLVALSRRFGPAWQEATVAQGSTSTFLRNLGNLHQDLGHHRAAATLLIQRARAYNPGLRLAEEIEERAEIVDNSQQLIELAQDVARAQCRR